MGAWSLESFGNDDACDWAGELEEYDDLRYIETTLDEVLAVGDDYLEADEASRAIAAAEVVARLHGNPGVKDAYSGTADAWVARVGLRPSPALDAKARHVLDRIVAAPSELLELWDESEDAGAWRASIADLKRRIPA